MKQNQRLYAAAVRARDVFCVAIVEPDEEDPYSYILSFEGSFSQPWSRTDARRVVNSVTNCSHLHDEPIFAAASSEGDIYILKPGATQQEKIIGAGLFGLDARGLGAIKSIAEIGGSLHASGLGSQVYRRQPDRTWNRLGESSLRPESGFTDISLGQIAGDGLDCIYACGSATPAKTKIATAEQEREMDEAAAANDFDRMMRIQRSLFDPNFVYRGRAYHWDGSAWNGLSLPVEQPINDVLIETREKVWLVGSGGAILCGNPSAGFQSLGFHGDTQTILSFTKFSNRYVAASDNALHWFNGHNLSPLRPTTLSGIATPLKVQAVDGVLFYFDYNQGVHRFDGETWEHIPIPPELLERDFKGLPQPLP